jgi:hypothetical protein
LSLDWRDNLALIFKGRALTLYTIERIELIKSKVWAYCDRSRDYEDFIAMSPSTQELEEVRKWLYPLDGNPEWPNWVDVCIEKIKKGAGHD